MQHRPQGQVVSYVGPTGNDISRPAKLNMTVFLSSSAALCGWVLVLIGSVVVGGKRGKAREGGIIFLVYSGAFFYFNSLLLISMGLKGETHRS